MLHFKSLQAAQIILDNSKDALNHILKTSKPLYLDLLAFTLLLLTNQSVFSLSILIFSLIRQLIKIDEMYKE